jgi:hypothetical protein
MKKLMGLMILLSVCSLDVCAEPEPAAPPVAKPGKAKPQSDSGKSPEVTVKESAEQSDVAGNGNPSPAPSLKEYCRKHTC